jgi:hypothetical protein
VPGLALSTGPGGGNIPAPCRVFVGFSAPGRRPEPASGGLIARVSPMPDRRPTVLDLLLDDRRFWLGRITFREWLRRRLEADEVTRDRAERLGRSLSITWVTLVTAATAAVAIGCAACIVALGPTWPRWARLACVSGQVAALAAYEAWMMAHLNRTGRCRREMREVRADLLREACPTPCDGEVHHP